MNHDLLSDLERALIESTWRGVVVRRRGGDGQALCQVPPGKLRRLGRALVSASPGHVIMIHTKGCKRRDARCSCSGLRLVAGARA
jgi:hypothetical protein